ncbi:2-amino-4-hydroxy-6-hydroxymethyldihydropteridine diphosphokinase [Flavobacteriales bacterium]|nr:2-amino-4-hydroxy-6-hydroxymethyldihydropteridine diphosphokinase [Flavobacteriales bacterium]
MESKVLLSLGSNLGAREENIEKAIALLQSHAGQILAVSPLYETPSWGYQDAPYLNNAVCLTTEKAPLELMQTLLDIESELGRERSNTPQYEARSIDLDIALIEGCVIDHPKLQVPHPRMHLRNFVLQPAADICPSWVHEKINISISELLLMSEDSSEISLFIGG